MFDIAPVPSAIRQSIEAELLDLGAKNLHQELMEKDPDSKIHINDHYRLVRAIEIIRHTGEIPSRLHAASVTNKNEFPFPYLKVGFDSEKSLYEGPVATRTKKMIECGIIEETRKLIAEGWVHWAPLQSVRYKETLEYLQTGKNEKWLFENINRSTMQLIKKQKTWFKRDATILWSNQEKELERFLS